MVLAGIAAEDQQFLHHEKHQHAELGPADQVRPRRRTQQARRRRRRGHGNLPLLHLHIFFHRRNEAVGRRQKQSLHLHALRQSHARRGPGKNRRARRSGSRGRHRERHGRHFLRAAQRAQKRRRTHLHRAALRRQLPLDARHVSRTWASRSTTWKPIWPAWKKN